jgi:hypothetical protein
MESRQDESMVGSRSHEQSSSRLVLAQNLAWFSVSGEHATRRRQPTRSNKQRPAEWCSGRNFGPVQTWLSTDQYAFDAPAATEVTRRIAPVNAIAGGINHCIHECCGKRRCVERHYRLRLYSSTLYVAYLWRYLTRPGTEKH